MTITFFKLWKKKYKVDRLVEEDAMVEELVDVVVVDVRIVSEDLMALKMRLLVVDSRRTWTWTW